MVYFDLDGVIRHLTHGLFEGKIQKWSQPLPNGGDLMEYLHANPEILLTAPPTELFHAIKLVKKIDIITSQPVSWRVNTAKWIHAHFPKELYDVKYTFVDNADDKLKFLENDEDLLIEDYPLFKDYSKIILIDAPYNQDVKNPRVRVKTPLALYKILGELNLISNHEHKLQYVKDILN